MIALRIWRADQLVCSPRPVQSCSESAVCCGRMRLKYQNRSMTMHHMTTQVMKIQSTIGPPSCRIV
jgi:hypothetical protein